MVFGKERNESIDLLRLIAMIFIVCIHYVGWGGRCKCKWYYIF